MSCETENLADSSRLIVGMRCLYSQPAASLYNMENAEIRDSLSTFNER